MRLALLARLTMSVFLGAGEMLFLLLGGIPVSCLHREPTGRRLGISTGDGETLLSRPPFSCRTVTLSPFGRASGFPNLFLFSPSRLPPTLLPHRRSTVDNKVSANPPKNNGVANGTKGDAVREVVAITFPLRGRKSRLTEMKAFAWTPDRSRENGIFLEDSLECYQKDDGENKREESLLVNGGEDNALSSATEEEGEGESSSLGGRSIPFSGGATVTKPELCQALAAVSSVSRSDVARVLDCLSSTVGKYIASGRKVYLSKLGAFGAKLRPARKARDPRNNTPVQVEESLAPTFTFSKSIKDLVKKQHSTTGVTTEATRGAPLEEEGHRGEDKSDCRTDVQIPSGNSSSKIGSFQGTSSPQESMGGLTAHDTPRKVPLTRSSPSTNRHPTWPKESGLSSAGVASGSNRLERSGSRRGSTHSSGSSRGGGTFSWQ